MAGGEKYIFGTKATDTEMGIVKLTDDWQSTELETAISPDGMRKVTSAMIHGSTETPKAISHGYFNAMEVGIDNDGIIWQAKIDIADPLGLMSGVADSRFARLDLLDLSNSNNSIDKLASGKTGIVMDILSTSNTTYLKDNVYKDVNGIYWLCIETFTSAMPTGLPDSHFIASNVANNTKIAYELYGNMRDSVTLFEGASVGLGSISLSESFKNFMFVILVMGEVDDTSHEIFFTPVVSPSYYYDIHVDDCNGGVSSSVVQQNTVLRFPNDTTINVEAFYANNVKDTVGNAHHSIRYVYGVIRL